jgi:hypothetical protein
MVRSLRPDSPLLWKTFLPVEVEVQGARLRYTPTGVSACAEPLEGILWPINRRLGHQVYEQLVAPVLAEQHASV